MAIQSKSREKLLVLKDKVSKEVAAITTSTTTTLDADNMLPVCDENGDLVGYIALYDALT